MKYKQYIQKIQIQICVNNLRDKINKINGVIQKNMGGKKSRCC